MSLSSAAKVERMCLKYIHSRSLYRAKRRR